MSQPRKTTGQAMENQTPTPAILDSSRPPGLRLSQPVQTMSREEAERRLQAYRAALQPAGGDAAIIPLTRLSTHYWQPDRPDKHWKIVVEDFKADLGRYPIDLIETACREWRTGPNSFFPKPGELIALIAPRHADRLRTAEELSEQAKTPESERGPPSGDEQCEVGEIVAQATAHLRAGLPTQRSRSPEGVDLASIRKRIAEETAPLREPAEEQEPVAPDDQIGPMPAALRVDSPERAVVTSSSGQVADKR